MADLRDYTKKNPVFVGTDGLRLPTGNSTQRVASANVSGTIRYNTDIAGMEMYTPNGWIPLAAPPSITTVSPSTYSGASGTEFTINGSGFTPDAQVYFITSNGTSILASTVTYYSSVQVRATTPRVIKVEEEPISVRVVQQSGTITKTDCIDAGGVPNWITTAGTLGSIFGANTVNVYVSATDPEGTAITYQITSGSLPGGLNFSTANGLIQGVASSVTANTTYNFTIKANDTVNNNTDRSFSYTVLNRAPVINTAAGSLGTIVSGNAASASISAYDPDGGSITYSVSSGTLPVNSSLGSANGVISGTPVVVTTNTTYSFTITSTDVGNLTASNNYTYTVLNRPPIWNTNSTLTSYSPETFTPITVNAYDPDGGSVSYALSSGSVPSGLTFVTANATITGTPADISDDTTSTFTVTATDVGEMGTARTFSLTITAPVDIQFSNTVLLLHGNANTVIKDESTNNLPITVVGDSGASNFSPYNTSWSAYFGPYSSASCLTYVPGSSVAFGTGNFTVECWAYFDSDPGSTSNGYILDTRGGGGGWAFSWNYNGAGGEQFNLSWADAGGTNRQATTQMPTNKWNHCAYVRSGTTGTIYLNGVSILSFTDSTNYSASVTTMHLGKRYSGNQSAAGYLSNLRIVNGTAVYTGNFTPPTSPLTSISGTSLLTFQDNRFKDNSTANSGIGFDITREGGAPRVAGFSPFIETDTTTGSMYFDGTGDYLTIPNNTAFSYNSTFSAELWYYSTHSSCTDVIPFSGNGNWDFIIPAATTVAFRWFVPGYGDTGAHTMIPNSWNHIAVAVSGGRLSFYLNGKRMYTNASVSFSLGGSDPSRIGYGSNSIMKGYISDVRVTRGSTPYDPTQTTITVPTSPLTTISGTSFLTLQKRQPHNNHAFIDSSRTKSLTTRFGNSSQGSFTPFSQTGWSNYFNGTSGLTTTSSANAGVASGGNVTIELWMNTLTTATNEGLSDSYNSLFGTTDEAAWNSTSYAFIYSSSGISLYNGNGGGALWTIATGTLHDGVWHHIAIVRSSGTWQVFVDGVSKGTTTTQGTRTLGNDSYRYGVGTVAPAGGSGSFLGYISNFRLTKSALYTSNFTPSTTPLTAITGTAILTCQSNRFLDNSNNASNFTTSGTPLVKSSSPFASNTVYSAANTGGSVYLDGTDDRIQVGYPTDFNLLASDWSFECWYYTTNAAFQGLLSKRTGTVASGWLMNTSGIYGDLAGSWRDSNSIVGEAAGSYTSQKYGQWTHICYTRSGTTVRMFLNGKLTYVKTSISGNIQQVTDKYLTIGAGGANGTNENLFIGYISGMRFIIGSIPTDYQTSSTTTGTQIFTPPTSPVTLTSQGALANSVSMLMNFNDAAIVDSSSKHVIETIADTKVSSTQSKFSGSSMYFDGTGDFITIKEDPYFRFGASDFTIEGWIYPTAIGGSGYYTLGWHNNGSSSSDVTGTTQINANVWTHIAWSKSGTSMRFYINGTLDAGGVKSVPAIIYNNSDPLRIAYGTDHTAGSGRDFCHCGEAGGPQNKWFAYFANGGTGNFIGHIADFRITRMARYTTNFTAPTRSFPNR